MVPCLCPRARGGYCSTGFAIMFIRATCSACASHYQLPDHLAGKNVRCKKCGGVFAVADAPVQAAAHTRPFVAGRGGLLLGLLLVGVLGLGSVAVVGGSVA